MITTTDLLRMLELASLASAPEARLQAMRAMLKTVKPADTEALVCVLVEGLLHDPDAARAMARVVDS